MNAHRWGVAATCVNCGIDHRTLVRALNGEVPRLDSLYRLLNGPNIPIKEALIGGTHQAAEGAEEIAASQIWLELEMVEKDLVAIIVERFRKLKERMELIDSPGMRSELPRRNVKKQVRISPMKPKAAPVFRRRAKG